jgi:hypothetical protein
MVATVLAPEICRGPAAETSFAQATVTCRIVTPVQPEAASHAILLSVWNRIVLGADGSPAMVREHGHTETVRQSSDTVSDGQSVSPVTWRMSWSYTRVSHAVEKPDAGQAITCGVTYTNRSAEGTVKRKQHAQWPRRVQARHPRSRPCGRAREAAARGAIVGGSSDMHPDGGQQAQRASSPETPPPSTKRLLPTAAMACEDRALGGEPETRSTSSCSH